MSDWIAAVILPGSEVRAEESLARCGYDHHIFWVKQRRVRRGRVVQEKAPAFPRYVFLRSGQCAEIQERVREVMRPVQFGEEPELVSEEVLGELCDRCGPGNVLDWDEPIEELRFRKGDRVRVLKNAAFGTVGIFVESAGAGRCKILLPWFGRMVEALMKVEDLEKVEKRGKRSGKRRARRGKRAQGYLRHGDGGTIAQATLLRSR